MARKNFIWHGDKVQEDISNEIDKRLDLMAIAWVNLAKANLSIAGGGNPSPRGDYPHKQTGHLRRNIMWEKVSKLVDRVGTNVIYGKFLELIYDRPFMSLTNMRIIPTFKKIMERPI
jgi:hypothetical protein